MLDPAHSYFKDKTEQLKAVMPKVTFNKNGLKY